MSESLLSIRVTRKSTQKHIAGSSVSPKKEPQERQNDITQVFLTDPPPSKRRMLIPSTPRQSTSAWSPPPLESTSAPSPPLESTFALIPKLIVVPADIELDENAEHFTFTMTNGLMDSDSDVDMDQNDESSPLPTNLHLVASDTDLTPAQIGILQAEDSANDRALKLLVILEDCLSFEWSQEITSFRSVRETFTGTPGPTFETDNLTPTDIFNKMFDLEFVDMLCEETNRYAIQKIESLKPNLTASSRLHRWTPTDRPEMISFFALMILQGLYPLPSEESYFKFNGFGTMPFFSRIMSYNRYILIKSMLHFTDNYKLTDIPTRSRMCKIQPVLDYFNSKFSSLFYPGQEIAFDESLLKVQNRLSFAQKIKKAARVGIKTYDLCDSSTGYLWQFSVNAGKNNHRTATNNDDDSDDDDRPDQTEHNTNTTDLRPTNATAKIIFDLMEPLLYRGHTLILDDFYNCPLLARCLKLRQTDCYGTIRLNREFVPSSLSTLVKSDLRYGELAANYCSDLSLMVWRDANLVSMISTYHMLQEERREKYGCAQYKPSVVLDFNKGMGGIDRKEQFLSAHPIERFRVRMWYKRLFLRLFSCAVFNCFVIYNTKHKISHRQFKTELAESLLKTYRQIDLTTESRLISRTSAYGHTTTTMQRNSKSASESRPYVEGNHFPEHSNVKRGRCWLCSHVRKITTRTVWRCMECKVNLCIEGCFRDYHKPQ